MSTVQANELRGILRDLGFRTRARPGMRYRDDVIHVRTIGDGRKGFGDAYTISYTQSMHEALIARADELAARGCRVTIFTLDNGGQFVSVARGYGSPAGVFRKKL
jgi:hypothetical protein